MDFVLFSKHIYGMCVKGKYFTSTKTWVLHTNDFFPEKWNIHGSVLWKGIKPNKNTMWKVLKHVFFRRRRGSVQWVGLKWFLRKLHFINLLQTAIMEILEIRGSGNWIPESAAGFRKRQHVHCTLVTLLIRYIRENFKIVTFSPLSSIYLICSSHQWLYWNIASICN